MMEKVYDSLHMGRALMDLYANEVGADFVDIRSFAAYVGGSPTNICVGAHRLGLRTALLTAVGDDLVGDFILNFLNKEGIETEFSVRKPGYRTSAAILGIQPPDKFPLVFYRENCADLELTIEDVLAAPIAQSRVFQFAGTNLSKDPSRSATMFAAGLAHRNGTEVILDIDFRPDQWHDPRAFGVSVRSILPEVDIVIGTEDELNAALLLDVEQMELTHSQVSDTRVTGNVEDAIAALLAMGPKVLVQKIGAEGVRVHVKQADGRIQQIDVPGYPVEVFNILGAGDAFAAGFLYGHVEGWGWYKSARLGNACGAIVVTKHGCANFTPTMAEVEAFVAARGGF